ncbi:MAG: CotH kinase family protein [Bacteroidales bacterium]|nr:CotH kinase family protein [Bacteroidales bacterium]
MRKAHWLIIGFLLLVPLQGWSQPAEKVNFSMPGGFYETSPVLELFPFYQQHHIRFTTNGNRPTAQSRLYTEPLLLDESFYSTSDIYTIQISPDEEVFFPDTVRHCVVIRAAVFDENDSCVSEVATNSYFIRALGCDTHGLPAVSLCADSLDLFDYHNGILVPGVHFDPQNPLTTGNYYQSGEDWERPVNAEYYENDNTGINQLAGLRIQGDKSRRFEQKALKIYAREDYGKKRFDYHFFETTPINSFKHLTLKPFKASWNQTGVNDYLANRIASSLHLETLASRPVVLFLNGEYWGIYFLHEKPDEHYLQDHLGVYPDQVTIVNGWRPDVDCGDPSNFIELFDWMTQADLRDPDAYAYAASKIDIDNFIDYYIFELFSENTDWPNHNMRCWQLGNGKWRWLFFDGDACLCWLTYYTFDNAVYEGNATYPSSKRASLFFRKLFVNKDFKQRFKARFLELLNTTFSYANTAPMFEQIKSIIASEIPLQAERFGFPADYDTWNSMMGNTNWFLMKRCEAVVPVLEEFMHWSVPEVTPAVVSVYPNPFIDAVTLHLDADRAKEEECSVYDLTGRQVYCQRVPLSSGANAIQLNLPLPPGVYVLRLGEIAIKIVRQ